MMQEFDVSMTVAILGFSLNLFGIAFAPIITPHLSERLGRVAVYSISLPLFSLFILGASRSQSFASLAVCRFFAGFLGGPCLVLIEGTFADCWRGHTTVTYYSILSLSSYIGAACGQSLSQQEGVHYPAENIHRTSSMRLCFRLEKLALDPICHSHGCSGRVSHRNWNA